MSLASAFSKVTIDDATSECSAPFCANMGREWANNTPLKELPNFFEHN